MRKLILLVVLVASLGGVLYVKSIRQTELEQKAFTQGRVEGVTQAESNRRSVDSLSRELEQFRGEMLDSLRSRDSAYYVLADSVSQVMAQQDDSIAQLEQKVDSRPNAKRITALAKEVDSTLLLKHREVLEYYTSRFRELPSDLSDYEKRVAAVEIRSETAEKFAITDSELNEIRKEANLDF